MGQPMPDMGGMPMGGQMGGPMPGMMGGAKTSTGKKYRLRKVVNQNEKSTDNSSDFFF